LKPKLYQYAACPFCGKVKSFLAYKKIDFETIEVNPLNKREIKFSEDYKAVPIYIDSKGRQVNDSNAIMKHIDEEFPEKKVFSDDPAQAAKDEQWLVWSEKYVKGLPTVVYETFKDSLAAFNYITKTGKFNWFQSLTIRYTGALAMTLVAKAIRKREQISDPAQFVLRMVGEWSDGLQGKPFMAGEKPGVADLSVFGISRAVGDLKASELFRKNQVFWQWLERMKRETNLELAVV